MNDQLEQQLALVLEKSLKLAEQTGEFVISQAPELLQEFYTWQTLSKSIDILGAVLIYLLARHGMAFLGSKQDFEYVKDKGYSFEKKVSA